MYNTLPPLNATTINQDANVSLDLLELLNKELSLKQSLGSSHYPQESFSYPIHGTIECLPELVYHPQNPIQDQSVDINQFIDQKLYSQNNQPIYMIYSPNIYQNIDQSVDIKQVPPYGYGYGNHTYPQQFLPQIPLHNNFLGGGLHGNSQNNGIYPSWNNQFSNSDISGNGNNFYYKPNTQFSYSPDVNIDQSVDIKQVPPYGYGYGYGNHTYPQQFLPQIPLHNNFLGGGLHGNSQNNGIYPSWNNQFLSSDISGNGNNFYYKPNTQFSYSPDVNNAYLKKDLLGRAVPGNSNIMNILNSLINVENLENDQHIESPRYVY